MIRFIHCADIHLGSPFTGLQQKNSTIASQAIEATKKAFLTLIETAIEYHVDFVLISGDIFDSSQQHIQEKIFLKEQFQRLAQSGIYTYLIHGNHDYGRFTEEWNNEFVKVFKKEVSTEILTTLSGESVAISGFSFETRWITESMALQFPMRNALVDYHIGMYHGQTCTTSDSSGAYAPFKVGDLEKLHYDYWALGHIHRAMDLDSDGRIAYSGTIQGRSFKEVGEKGFYLVTLDKTLPMERNFMSCNSIEWIAMTFDCEKISSVEFIVAKLYHHIAKKTWNSDKTYLLKFVLKVSRGFNQAWLKLIEDILQNEIAKNYSNLYVIEMEVDYQSFKENNQLWIDLLEDEESHQNRFLEIQTTAMQHSLLAKYFSKEMSSQSFQHKIIQKAKCLIETNMEEGDENVH
ncbi:metallophosphoesterase family protein [Granulicatella elegans]|uniref:metallophosphoesterase family protein n=1 Tax=Granulicatella elegans TaxID=137732 RepID=UPI001D150E50|nr:DNA repair exonuclease [Granulicatella elegans]UEA30824.1 DNA repair exonuclease [Granulicatella elegans]